MNEILSKFSDLHITVIGDVILDRYIWGSVSRISPEAPVPVVHAKDRSRKVGGAANAAQVISALGARVTVMGRIGDDRAGRQLRTLMESQGLEFEPLPNQNNLPTTIKTRIIAQNQHLLRMDEEDRTEIPLSTLEKHGESLGSLLKETDGILISDYAKGVFAPESLPFWMHTTRESGRPVVIDPHTQHFRLYRGARIMTPNERELREGMGDSGPEPAALEELSRAALDEVECSALLVTQGERGMTLFDGNEAPYSLATEAREVYDVTGAGDTVSGIMALGEALELDRRTTCRLANTAAGRVVGRMGTATVTVEELREALA